MDSAFLRLDAYANRLEAGEILATRLGHYAGSPSTTGYDTPATQTMPSSLDSTTSGLPGQRTQDTP